MVAPYTSYADDFHWKYYWSVDLPGLTEEQAHSLVSISADRFGTHGLVIEPTEWFTLHADVETARVIHDALPLLDSNEIAVAMREETEDWLHAINRQSDLDRCYARDFYQNYYWSVDIIGLTEEQAQSLVSISADRFGIHGTAIDPTQCLVQNLDEDTARVIRDALLLLDSNDIAVAMRTRIDEWLHATGRSQADE